MTGGRWLKRLAAHLAAPASDRLASEAVVTAPILCYHGVAKAAVPEHIGVVRFAAQMDVFRATARPCFLYELVTAVTAGRTPLHSEPPLAAISFDDGYANIAEQVLPLHRQSPLRATVFVVPGKLGIMADWPSPAPQSERRLLSRMQLDLLREAGFEIGGHGWSHIDLTSCSPQQRTDEIWKCREFLAQAYGTAEPVFCYPWGRYNAEVVREVRAAGFFAAVCTGWGLRHRPAERYELRRITIDAHDERRDFQLKLRGGWGWWTRAWWRDVLGR